MKQENGLAIIPSRYSARYTPGSCRAPSCTPPDAAWREEIIANVLFVVGTAQKSLAFACRIQFIYVAQTQTGLPPTDLSMKEACLLRRWRLLLEWADCRTNRNLAANDDVLFQTVEVIDAAGSGGVD